MNPVIPPHPHEQTDAQRRAARIYATLLRLYPRAHRRAFGAQMLQTFQDHYRDTVETGAQREGMFWLGVVGDESRSLLRERVAALTEKESRMQATQVLRKAPATALSLVALVAFLWLIGRQFAEFPEQAAMWAGLIALDIALFALLARIAPRFLTRRDERAPSWARVGLTLGAALGAYFVVVSLLYAFYPVASQVGSDVPYDLGLVWLANLPLLGGALGISVNVLCDRRRAGLSAGLLAAGIGTLAYIASQALLIALLWSALRQNLLQSRLEMTYQAWYTQALGWSQFTNQPLTVQQFMFSAYGIGFLRFVPFFGLDWLILAGLFAALGNTLVAASRHAHMSRLHQAAPGEQAVGAWPPRCAIRLVLVFVGLGGLALLGSGVTHVYASLRDPAHDYLMLDTVPFTLNVLSASFASVAIATWFIAVLIASASLLVMARAARVGDHA